MASEGWTTATIGSLIEKGIILAHKDGNHGANYPRVSDFGNGGVPFLTAKLLDDAGNIDFASAPRLAKNKADKFTFGFIKSGDVLLSHNATVGRVAVVPELKERVLIGTSLTHFRLDPNRLLPRYLAAYFTSRDFQNQLAAVMSQTTRNQVPITAQRRLNIVIPPLFEQATIANTLSAFDNKIEFNRQINQTLEQIAQAIFKSWFVDFEPVKAKIEAKANGQDPERAAMCAISGKTGDELDLLPLDQLAQLRATGALFPEELTDSELGSIPKGWRPASLGDFVGFQNGYAFKSKDWTTGGFPVVKIGSVKPGFVDLESCSYVSEDSVTGLDRFLLLPGDILVGMTGYPGETGLVPHYETKVYLNQRVGKLLTEYGNHGFVFCAVRNDRFKSFVESQSHGSAQANVSSKAILSFPLINPGTDLTDRIEQLIQPVIQKMLMLQYETKTLDQLRDTLLPKLLSGEIELSQVA